MLISATTGVFAAEAQKVPCNEGLDGCLYSRGATTVKDFDPHLVEAHQRPEPHAPCNESRHAVLGEVVHRCEASTCW